MKARAWLVERGLAQPTRGKFSKDAHTALAKALAEGVAFSDYPKSATAPVPVSSPDSQATGIPVVKSDPRDSMYLTPSEYRFPEAEYRAVAKVGGKVYGMRECCSNCRVSFVNHGCDNPVIYGNVAVAIVANKGVKHQT